MADPKWRISQFLFRNKLRHDITAIVKGYLCVCQILDFIKHLTINLKSISRFMATLRQLWILLINLTI